MTELQMQGQRHTERDRITTQHVTQPHGVL